MKLHSTFVQFFISELFHIIIRFISSLFYIFKYFSSVVIHEETQKIQSSVPLTRLIRVSTVISMPGNILLSFNEGKDVDVH